MELFYNDKAKSIPLLRKSPQINRDGLPHWDYANKSQVSPDGRHLVITYDYPYSSQGSPYDISARVIDIVTRKVVANLSGYIENSVSEQYMGPTIVRTLTVNNIRYSQDGSKLYLVMTDYETLRYNQDNDQWTTHKGVVRCYNTADWSLDFELKASDELVYDHMDDFRPKDITITSGGLVITCEGVDSSGEVIGFVVYDPTTHEIRLPTIPSIGTAVASLTFSEQHQKAIMTFDQSSNYPRMVAVWDYDAIDGTYTVDSDIESKLETSDTIIGGSTFITQERYVWVVSKGYVDSDAHVVRIIDLGTGDVLSNDTEAYRQSVGDVLDSFVVNDRDDTVTIFGSQYVLVYDLNTFDLISMQNYDMVGDGVGAFASASYSSLSRNFYGVDQSSSELQNIEYRDETIEYSDPIQTITRKINTVADNNGIAQEPLLYSDAYTNWKNVANQLIENVNTKFSPIGVELSPITRRDGTKTWIDKTNRAIIYSEKEIPEYFRLLAPSIIDVKLTRIFNGRYYIKVVFEDPNTINDGSTVHVDDKPINIGSRSNIPFVMFEPSREGEVTVYINQEIPESFLYVAVGSYKKSTIAYSDNYAIPPVSADYKEPQILDVIYTC